MARIDSNAAQFERAGNPWVTEAERVEFSAPPRNNRERRQQRNGVRPRVDLGNFPRMPERSSRDGDPMIAQMQRSSRFLAAFRSGLPGGTREVAPAKRPLIVDPVVRHPALTELTPRQLVIREQQRAEVAERCAKADIADEKARLEHQLRAIQARLAELG